MSVCICVCERGRHTHREHKASNRRGLYVKHTVHPLMILSYLERRHVFLCRKCLAIELYKVIENGFRHFSISFMAIQSK